MKFLWKVSQSGLRRRDVVADEDKEEKWNIQTITKIINKVETEHEI